MMLCERQLSLNGEAEPKPAGQEDGRKSVRKRGAPRDMEIRRFELNDTVPVMKLFSNTVRAVNIQDYSVEQVEVWAACGTDLNKWTERLAESITFIALDKNELVGFGNLTEQKVIDLLYVHKDYQNKGIGKALLAELEREAGKKGYPGISTEASIMAKDFFQACGYRVIKEQTKILRGTVFTTYAMDKKIYGS